MPHGEFLNLLQAIEAHRRAVGLPALPVDDFHVAMGTGIDQSGESHRLETENAP